MGFFTDAYDLFCISLVTKLLGSTCYHVEGSPKPGTLPPNVTAAVNGVALVGKLAGQVVFGWLGDKMGEKKWFGIGDDYPLSATIMSEYANKKTRGAFVAAFAMLISAIFEAKFNAPAYEVDPVGSTVPEADNPWRIILMVDIEAEPVRLPKETMQSFGLFSKEFIHTKDIVSTIGWIPNVKILNAVSQVYRIAGAQTLIALCSMVPGYLFTAALIEKIGRFTIQVMGFFFMTVFMFILAFLYNYWTHQDHLIGFVVFYSLSSLQISDLMPTTFLVPPGIFPARLRSTCHGISAAAGKLEAMVGAFCSSSGAIF
ncbi:hypothetical protein D8674_003286 [Pyrus ussuriensis x Pyrus communis]|uniref:Major facilitator superfamily (MFS) profile domain-containing protein n=1 Tax=Pyrus ussuriensis x Pyrus communis TaxID=2448454 RepID=A0A5N5FKT1_9ROSA|nr:hypothetical protein D8674_003286 [Pyrus ussuriensis x Pyrus communis]